MSRISDRLTYANATVALIAVAATLAMLFASRSDAAWSGATEVSDATTRGASNLAADANALGDLVLAWSKGGSVASVIKPADSAPPVPQLFVPPGGTALYAAPTVSIGGNHVAALAFRGANIVAAGDDAMYAASKASAATAFSAPALIEGPRNDRSIDGAIAAVNNQGTGQLFHERNFNCDACTHKMAGRILTDSATNVWSDGIEVSSHHSGTYNREIATAADGSSVVLWKTNNGSNARSIEPAVIENDGTVAKGSSIVATSGNLSGALTNPSAFALDRMPDAAVVAAFVRKEGTGGGIFVADFSKARASGTGAIPAVRVSDDADGSQSEVATDDAGNTLVTWYDPSDGGDDPNALRSVFRVAGSSDWGPIQTIATENVTDHDMEVDALGNAYVVYEAGDVIKAASRRPGASAGWSAPVTLSTAQVEVGSPTVAAGRNYEAFASWIGTGTDNVYLATADITPVACEDGVDNDSDGAVDFPADPGCSALTDNDETDLGPGPDPTTTPTTLTPIPSSDPGPSDACKVAADKVDSAEAKVKKAKAKVKKADGETAKKKAKKKLKKAKKKLKKAEAAEAAACNAT